jgi:hypothetical protein
MKRIPVLFMVMCITFFLLTPCADAHKDDDGKISIDYSFREARLVTDSHSHLDVTIKNIGDNNAKILKVGLHTDWMDEDQYSSQGPNKDLPRENKTTVTIAFKIPENASLGLHMYNVTVWYQYQYGVGGGWNDLVLKSTTRNDLEVEQNMGNGGGDDDEESFFDLGFIKLTMNQCLMGVVAILVLAIVLGVALRLRHRKKQQAFQKELEAQQAQRKVETEAAAGMSPEFGGAPQTQQQGTHVSSPLLQQTWAPPPDQAPPPQQPAQEQEVPVATATVVPPKGQPPKGQPPETPPPQG